jgi:hypothetical protein
MNSARRETLGAEGEGKSVKLPLYETVAAGGAVLPQDMALVCKQRTASEAMSMSDQDDWGVCGPGRRQSGNPRRSGVFAERCYRRRPR